MSKKNKKTLNSKYEEFIPYLKMEGDKDRVLKNSSDGKETLANLGLCIEDICNNLLSKSTEYDPSVTVKKTQNYLNQKDNERVLYSKISEFLFGLNDNDEGVFSTNISKLIEYSFNEDNKISPEIKNEILKIYDHSLLVTYQKNNVENILKKGIEKTKDEIKNEVKNDVTEIVSKDATEIATEAAKNAAKTDVKKYEKEYITILGIFAAIVIAFVGGMTFSTSVLNNIDKVSIYRLVLVIDLIAFVLINAMYLLIAFIGKVSETPGISTKPLLYLDLIFGAVLVLITGAWFFDISSFAEFHQRTFGWKKQIELTTIPEVTTENIKSFISLIF